MRRIRLGWAGLGAATGKKARGTGTGFPVAYLSLVLTLAGSSACPTRSTPIWLYRVHLETGNGRP